MQKLTLIILFLGSCNALFSQQKSNKAICDQIKNEMLSKGYFEKSDHLSNSINIDSLNQYIAIFRKELLEGELVYEYEVSENINGTLQVTSYGYRWANSDNVTQFGLELKPSNLVVEELLFQSHQQGIPSRNFPFREITDADMPPAAPPLIKN